MLLVYLKFYKEYSHTGKHKISVNVSCLNVHNSWWLWCCWVSGLQLMLSFTSLSIFGSSSIYIAIGHSNRISPRDDTNAWDLILKIQLYVLELFTLNKLISVKCIHLCTNWMTKSFLVNVFWSHTYWTWHKWKIGKFAIKCIKIMMTKVLLKRK